MERSVSRFVVVSIFAVIILSVISLLAWGLVNKSSVTGQSGATRVGKEAPDFDLVLFDGGRLKLSERRGTIIVLNFWSSMCPPCREEAPIFEQAWRQYKDRGVLFVGANIQDYDEGARDFIDEFSITYPNGPDENGHITIDYGVVGMPVTFFVDPEGIVARRWVGSIDEPQLTTWIEDLLGGHPSGDIEGGNQGGYYKIHEVTP